MRLRPYLGLLSIALFAHLAMAQGVCRLVSGRMGAAARSSSHCHGMSGGTEGTQRASRHGPAAPTQSHDGPTPSSCCAGLASCAPAPIGAAEVQFAELDGPKATLPAFAPGRLLARTTAPEPPPPKQIGR